MLEEYVVLVKQTLKRQARVRVSAVSREQARQLVLKDVEGGHVKFPDEDQVGLTLRATRLK
jgi:hypothetical protein